MEGESSEIRKDPMHHETFIERREIDKCTGIINAMIRNTNMEIDSIKTSNERHERDRRFEEELKRQERYKQIQLEAMKSARKNAELEMRWSEYREMEECQELHQNLLHHKQLFKELIDSKRKLIDELSDTLKLKDTDYNKTIENMKHEIDIITKSMRDQFKELRNTSILELQNIEANLSQQRNKLIGDNDKKITETFKEHKSTEDTNTSKRTNQEKTNKKELEDMIIKNEISYASLKIKSETEIQNCEKCLEDMRALYQLNAVKLKYNFKVLKEKKTENTQLKGELKKKERFFSGMYKGKKDDYRRKDLDFKKKNKKLTEQYRMISKQYKDLHKKFKHFKKADIERYNEIKEMNLKEIKEMKEQIIRCDKIIHMQQLGVVWEAPEQEEEDETNVDDLDQLDDLNQNSMATINNESKTNNENKSSVNKNELSNFEEDEGQYDVPPIQMNAIINVVLEETDFLLDDKIMSEINKSHPKERLLLKMNVLRKVLAISDPLEFKKLIYKIYLTTNPEPTEPKPALVFNDEREDDLSREESRNNRSSNLQQEDEVNYEGEEEEDPELQYQQEELEVEMEKYDPDILIMILGDFIEEKKNKIVLNNQDQRKKKTLEREKREKELKKEKKFWDNMSQVLPEERIQMWKILDKISSKYYKLLLDRQKLIQETTDLHNQNDELKSLLNQYLNINHNLLVPPSGIINVNFLE